MRCAWWVVGFAAAASAQESQLLRPAPGTSPFLTVESAHAPGHLALVPALTVGYAHRPVVTRDASDGAETDIVAGITTANLVVSFGLWERVELSVDAPFHSYEGEHSGLAPGDILLTPKVTMLGVRAPYGLAVAAPVSVPLGPSADLMGEGQVTMAPRLLFELRTSLVSFGASAGVRVRPTEHPVGRYRAGDALTYGLGGVFSIARAWDLLVEAFGAAPLESTGGDSRDLPLEVLGGARWRSPFGPVLTLAGGLGAVPGFGTPAFRAFGTFGWTFGGGDSDADGVADAVDACPDTPEDRDEFEDGDGCPDADDDGDGVPDFSDRCPREAGEGADGCPAPAEPPPAEPPPAEPPPAESPPAEPPPAVPPPAEPPPVEPPPEEPPPAEPAPAPPPAQEEGPVHIEGDVVVFEGDVRFPRGGSILTGSARKVLDPVAEFLVAHPELLKLRVEAHTDNRTWGASATKLTNQRARRVRAHLVHRGVDPRRLSYKGYGNSDPIADNKTREGREKNRRVVFRIVERAEEAGGGEAPAVPPTTDSPR